MTGRVSVLGIPIDALTRAEVRARCEQALAGGRLVHIVTANPEILLRAQADSAYATVLRQADLVVADGAGVVLAAWMRDQPLPERFPGVELLTEISQLAAGAGPTSPSGLPTSLFELRGTSRGAGKSVFLLGAQFGVAPDVAKHLQRDIPYLSVTAFVPEHDADDPPPELWAHLQKARPAVLFVAYGAPKQEQWIAQHRQRLEELGVRIAMGVGGAFDILSGRLPRAPHWMRLLGLEWLWRLWLEPARLPRILRATFVFPLMVLFENKS
ncbi:MAG: N-acetylglucosaminyldiphosphoundecaprenol [Parcubacteria group bacterium Gr01-1014_106]|nr:MAG: N-acetylglucosaminyldiphosphoundecaprenol [Parcubacteria group bacterium Gr01-1014_106]